MTTQSAYSRKLASPKWQKKRLIILNRDKWKCRYCGDDKTELHVHHLKYTGKNPEDAPNKDLITACADCHYAITDINKISWEDVIASNKFVNSDGWVSLSLVATSGIYFYYTRNKDGLLELQFSTGVEKMRWAFESYEKYKLNNPPQSNG